MDNDKLITQAAEVIQTIQYINIASITPEGEPWNTAVYTAFDKNLNFFWHSWNENQHSKNINHKSQVFVTIYDSTVPEGSGFGIFMQGEAKELLETVPIAHAIERIYARRGQDNKSGDSFLAPFPRRIYQFTPKHIWVNDWIEHDQIKGHFVDERKELDLNALKNVLK